LTIIPTLYRQPLGFPFNWRDEQSGQLPQAVMAYLSNRVDATPLKPDHLQLVRAYCQYYINAPCWTTTTRNDPDAAPALTRARQTIRTVTTASGLSRWIAQCLNLGIDPL
jgi:hypothetical protein